jgi:PEP-utilising enzyme, mobile domain
VSDSDTDVQPSKQIAARLADLRFAAPNSGHTTVTVTASPPARITSNEAQDRRSGSGTAWHCRSAFARECTSSLLEPCESLPARASVFSYGIQLHTTVIDIVDPTFDQRAHAAIVAREYGVPTVVGVAHATKALVTGMRVRVHGSSGNVEILSDA